MHAENHNDVMTGWRKRLHFDNAKKGVTKAAVHSKKIDGFPVEFTRSSVTFPGISLDIFDSYMRQMDQIYKNKGGKDTQFKTIDTDVDGRPTLCYFKFKMNMFIADRDGCFSMKRQVREDGTIVYITQSAEHPDCPV